MAENTPIEAEMLSQEEQPSSELALASQVLPTTLYLLPLTDRPFFPAQTFPVVMDEQPWLETVEHVGDHPHHLVGLVLLRGGDLQQLSHRDFNTVGSVVRIHQPARAGEKIQFIAEGIQRFRIVKWLSDKPPFMVEVEYPPEERTRSNDKLKAYAMAIINIIKELIPLNPLYSEELKYFLSRFSPNEPSPLTDFAAALTTAKKEQLQSVLETFPILPRMEKVLVLIKNELEVARLQTKIRERVDERMNEQQRKFFLREQLKEIQKELGLEKDDRTADVERFRQQLEGLVLPETAQKRIDDELQKLSILELGSPEYTVTRNYLDWPTSLPRRSTTKAHPGPERARDRAPAYEEAPRPLSTTVPHVTRALGPRPGQQPETRGPTGRAPAYRSQARDPGPRCSSGPWPWFRCSTP